jgi:hypothetical protein
MIERRVRGSDEGIFDGKDQVLDTGKWLKRLTGFSHLVMVLLAFHLYEEKDQDTSSIVSLPVDCSMVSPPKIQLT